jgi:hypothetical protein
MLFLLCNYTSDCDVNGSGCKFGKVEGCPRRSNVDEPECITLRTARAEDLSDIVSKKLTACYKSIKSLFYFTNNSSGNQHINQLSVNQAVKSNNIQSSFRRKFVGSGTEQKTKSESHIKTKQAVTGN